MNQDLQKFRELLLTDREFQKKLQSASETYTGEQSEEAVFNAVLVPVAAEYGISASYDEFQEYLGSLADAEMSKDELQQVAGGGKGQGATGCYVVGIGLGGGSSDGEGGGCVFVGFGWGDVDCSGEGVSH